MAEVTHSQLVKRACRWLASTRRCKLVLREVSAQCCSEIPDAIGWDARGRSTAVECKVSRADFLADKRKPSGSQRAGWWRYYMTPPSLIATWDLPPGVGLLEAGRCVRVKREAEPSLEMNAQAEAMLLVAEFMRVVGACRGRQDAVGLFAADDPELLDGLQRFRRWVDQEQAAEAKKEQAQTLKWEGENA